MDALVSILRGSGRFIVHHGDDSASAAVRVSDGLSTVIVSRTAAYLKFGGQPVGQIDDLRISDPGVVAVRVSDALGGRGSLVIREESVERGLKGSGAVRLPTAGGPAWVLPDGAIVNVRTWGVEVLSAEVSPLAVDLAWSRRLALAVGVPAVDQHTLGLAPVCSCV